MNKVFGSILVAAGWMALVLCSPAPAWSKGPQGVSNTKHNLSVTAPLSAYRTNEDEVCIFCHTPHGGANTAPLWNHALPAANSFTHYNSATLSSEFNGATGRNLNSESLLCMSCHDGSIAATRVLNTSNDLGDTGDGVGQPTVGGVPAFIPQVLPGPTNYPANIGNAPGNLAGAGDLTDDHPVSFSYYNAWNDPAENELVAPSTLITAQGTPGSDTPWFFGTVAEVAGGMRVECSTCHDPHVDYTASGDTAYSPFLVMPNSGSQMCFACHIK